MSQQVKVSQDLVFRGPASHTDNVEGNISFKKVVYYDDFLGKAIDATNDYTFAGVNSGTATITVPHCLTLTTGNADNDDDDFAMGVEWYGQYNACMEVKFRVDDVDNSGVNIGFSDATGEAADKIAMTATGATPTLTSNADDAAMFLHDGDATTQVLYAVSCKGGADGATIASSITLGDADWVTVRVELVDNGTTTNAVFYANAETTGGTSRAIDPLVDLVGVELDAVTRTTALCPYIALINHPGVSETLDVDYIKVWQDRT